MPRHQDTTTKVNHPDPLRLGPLVLERCDGHPFDTIKDGDPTFGWEGDQNLQLYLNRQLGTWDVFRLEHDGVYRRTVSYFCNQVNTLEIAPKVITWLIKHDTNRGYDLITETYKDLHKKDAEKEEQINGIIDEYANRLKFSLEREAGL